MYRRWPACEQRKNLCPLPQACSAQTAALSTTAELALHFSVGQVVLLRPWEGSRRARPLTGLLLLSSFCVNVLISPLISLWALGLKLTLLGNHYVCKFCVYVGGFLAVLLGTEMLVYSQLGEIMISWNQEKLYFFFLVEPCSCRDLNSWTRDQTSAPAVEARNLNHWTTREAPKGKFLNKRDD